MDKIGYKANETLFHYVDKGGQHNEYYWGRRFSVPMTKLYPWWNDVITHKNRIFQQADNSLEYIISQ